MCNIPFKNLRKIREQAEYDNMGKPTRRIVLHSLRKVNKVMNYEGSNKHVPWGKKGAVVPFYDTVYK